MAAPLKIDYPSAVVVRQPTFHFADTVSDATDMDTTMGQAGQPGENVADGDMIVIQTPLTIYEVTP